MLGGFTFRAWGLGELSRRSLESERVHKLDHSHIYAQVDILYSVQIVRGVGNAARITKFKRIFQDNPACFLFVVRISLRGSREVGEATTHHYYAYVKKTTILYFILVKLNTKHEELHRCTVKICVCSAQIKYFDRQDKGYVGFYLSNVSNAFTSF